MTGDEVVEVTVDDGVITAAISSASVEEVQVPVILDSVRRAMDRLGDDLQSVVLDFGEVGFINSSGLAACIEIRNGANEKGATTIIYRPRDEVVQVFRMVRVDRLYTIVSTPEELAGALSSR